MRAAAFFGAKNNRRTSLRAGERLKKSSESSSVLNAGAVC
jgi:hypothetical protein